MSLSLYLHIPYCRSLCPFCHFFRVPRVPEDWRPFFRAIRRDMEQYRAEGREPVRTFYVGGGTPTLLPADFFEAVLGLAGEYFDLSDLREATIETDGEATPDQLGGLVRAGFDRLSIGVKSFLGQTRSLLGIGASRDPDPVSRARREGFPSVSLDLVYGIEGQSREDFAEDLGMALGQAPDHVSLYCLEAEEGKGPRQGDPDEAAAMFRISLRSMGEAGFSQYEITNFARPGHRSLHNVTYWEDGDYIGIGPSAHSSLTREGIRVRWRNRPDLKAYLEDPVCCREDLSRESGVERAREALVLGLRMREGVAVEPFGRRYGFDPLRLLRGHLRCLKDAGLLRFDSRRLRLTPRGMFLSNEVFGRILENPEVT